MNAPMALALDNPSHPTTDDGLPLDDVKCSIAESGEENGLTVFQIVKETGYTFNLVQSTLKEFPEEFFVQNILGTFHYSLNAR